MVDIRLSQDPNPERPNPIRPKPPEANMPVELAQERLFEEHRGGPRFPVDPPEIHRQRRMWWIAAILAAIVAGLLLASSVWTSGDAADEDKLGSDKVDAAKIAPEKQCALQGTYDLIKRELFRRAAQTRGAVPRFERDRLVAEAVPQSAQARNNFGGSLLLQGRVAEAIPHLQEALRLDPSHAEAHSNLGVALARRGQTAEAIEQAAKVNDDPQVAEVLDDAAVKADQASSRVGWLRGLLHRRFGTRRA